MTRPPSRRREAQSRGFLLRRLVALLGIFAVLIAAASVIPVHGQATADPLSLTSCASTVHDDCGTHAVDRTCSVHLGCFSAAVIAAGSLAGRGSGQHWSATTLPPIAGWAGFPTKPPPISLL